MAWKHNARINNHTRTFEVEYLGESPDAMGSLFDDIVKVFEAHGLTIEGASDTVTPDCDG